MKRIKRSANNDFKSWIESIIAEEFELSSAEVLTYKTRKREIVIPRQLATMLLVFYGKSLSTVAAYYGQKHCNAIYSKNSIIKIIETKDTNHGYNRIVRIIKRAHMVYPQINMSKLPRGWDDPCKQIHQSQSRNRHHFQDMP